MKIKKTLICIFIISLFSCNSKNKTAYVISNTLVSEYQGMKDAKATFKQKQMTWQANLDSLQSQYQKALNTEPSKAQIYLQNVNKYKSQVQIQAEQEDDKMTQTVLDQINTFTELYGEKHGYDLILGTTSQGNILYGAKSINITDQMLQALNRYYATGEIE